MRLKHFIGIGLFLFSSHMLSAQIADTFMITLITKTPEHPFYGMGSDLGFSVDGVEGKTIVMERKKIYRFQSDPNTFDYYSPSFYTVPIGGGRNFFHRNASFSSVSKSIIVRPDSLFPDTLYYGSPEYAYMGGTMLIVDSITASVRERGGGVREVIANHHVTPNPFAHSASLIFNLFSPSEVEFKVIDLLGRVVVQENLGQLEAGTHNLPVNEQDIPVGLYYYTIETETVGRREIVSGKLQILR